MCLRTRFSTYRLASPLCSSPLNSDLLCAPCADSIGHQERMICPRLASEVRLLPRRSVNAAREGPVALREPPWQVGAGTHREGQDIDCISDARVHNRLGPVFRNAQRKATIFNPVVQRVGLEQKFKPCGRDSVAVMRVKSSKIIPA
jgi:hypothetical protein